MKLNVNVNADVDPGGSGASERTQAPWERLAEEGLQSPWMDVLMSDPRMAMRFFLQGAEHADLSLASLTRSAAQGAQLAPPLRQAAQQMQVWLQNKALPQWDATRQGPAGESLAEQLERMKQVRRLFSQMALRKLVHITPAQDAVVGINAPEQTSLSLHLVQQILVSDVLNGGQWQVQMVLDPEVLPDCVVDLTGSPDALHACLICSDASLQERVELAARDLETMLKTHQSGMSGPRSERSITVEYRFQLRQVARAI
jgi:hypothetical protein